MKKIKVNQLISVQSGNPVANQFEIRTDKDYYFQSYNSIILQYNFKKQQWYLDKTYWDYSNTTGRYRGQILGEGIAITRKKIKSKEYKLKDLNK
jgi:hypothetical protein